MIPTIKEIIMSWKESLPAKLSHEARVEAFNDLIATILQYKYSPEDCKSQRTFSLIIYALVSPTVTGQKRVRWEGHVKTAWDRAIAQSFPIEIIKADPSKIKKLEFNDIKSDNEHTERMGRELDKSVLGDLYKAEDIIINENFDDLFGDQ